MKDPKVRKTAAADPILEVLAPKSWRSGLLVKISVSISLNKQDFARFGKHIRQFGNL